MVNLLGNNGLVRRTGVRLGVLRLIRALAMDLPQPMYELGTSDPLVAIHLQHAILDQVEDIVDERAGGGRLVKLVDPL